MCVSQGAGGVFVGTLIQFDVGERGVVRDKCVRERRESGCASVCCKWVVVCAKYRLKREAKGKAFDRRSEATAHSPLPR
jgi:hypothetical protein